MKLYLKFPNSVVGSFHEDYMNTGVMRNCWHCGAPTMWLNLVLQDWVCSDTCYEDKLKEIQE